MLDRLNGILGGVLAAESWTKSQTYFCGHVNGNEDHQVWIVPGALHRYAKRSRRHRDRQAGQGQEERKRSRADRSRKPDSKDRRTISEPELRSILAALPNDPGQFAEGATKPIWLDRTVWVELAHAIAGCTGKAPWARAAFVEWSAQYDGDLAEPERVWDTLGNVKAGLSTLIDMYESWHGAGSFALGGARPPAFSDDALALRFAELHADEMRHVAAWGQWLRFDGARWVPDKTLTAFDLARRICREAAQVAAAAKAGTASAITSAKTVAAVVSLARADRRLAMTEDQWDTDPGC